MRISVIGTGYVGLITGVCLADLGHSVTCVDVIKEKVDVINSGVAPIYEVGLEDLLKKNIGKKLNATLDLSGAIANSEVTFIAVGTPSADDGSTDLKYIESAATGIGKALRSKEVYHVVIVKSTVPPKTTELVGKIIEKESGKKQGKDFGLAMNPEFLREGTAVYDFINPDRIVIGALDQKSFDVVNALYSPHFKCPIVKTELRTAEMIKYASNAFLATKISFANEIGNACKALGIDTYELMDAVGSDKRIGRAFLNSGVGYGGSCFDANEKIFVVDDKGIRVKKIKEVIEQKSDKFILGFDKKTNRVRISKITGLFKRPYKGKMVKLKLGKGRKITITADHPLVVQENGEFKIALADSVVADDFLPVSLNLPNQSSTKIDVIDFLSKNEEFKNHIMIRPKSGSFKDIKDQINKELIKIEPVSWKRHESGRKNYIHFEVFLALEKAGAMPFNRDEILLFTNLGTPTYAPAIVDLNQDFCRFIGYYLSEGCVSVDKSLRGNRHRERIKISFNINENEYVDDVCSILNKLNVRNVVYTREKNQTKEIVFSSRIFAFLLKNILECGKDCYDKQIPPQMFFLSKECKTQLLSGLFRGDGSATHSTAGELKYPEISYATVSPMLSEGITIILQSLGIIPSRSKIGISKKTKVQAESINIYGLNQVEKAKVFYSNKILNKINNQLLQYSRQISPMDYHYDTNHEIAYLKVKDIESFDTETEVY